MDQPQEEFIEPQSAHSNPDKEHADEVENAEQLADYPSLRESLTIACLDEKNVGG